VAALGNKVLIVEDEAPIALFYKDVLEAAGYTILGPTFRLEDALRLLPTIKPDAALVDLNLNGQMSFPVLDMLAAAKVPCGIISAHMSDVLPNEYRAIPRLNKPVFADVLAPFIAGLLAAFGASIARDGRKC